ncbi:MAG: hypothetical protein M3328_06015 [Chloroflexota bacterium]|nr:hypothetical protein [Chloroflexota bacterium]
MADNNTQNQGLSDEELQSQSANELPDREAMSLINANLALPVNAAVAANVLSDGSIAYADADQQAIIDQSTGGGNWTDLAGDNPTGG